MRSGQTSIWLAQLTAISPLADARLANDRSGPIVLHVSKVEPCTPHFYVYVDNLGVISTDEAKVSTAMSELQECFNSKGLELHASEITRDSVEALGCVLEGRKMRSRCNSKRLWKIHHGIKGLLAKGRCTGKALEVVIGHCTFLGLISRGSLSCFHSVYSFIQKYYGEVASLWPSVRSELSAFMGLCFLMVQDWWRPWNRLVTSSDSSLAGYGACKSWWPKKVVSDVGRVLERSRFRRKDSHSARESALTSAGFHLKGTEWSPFDEKSLLDIADSGWEVVTSFPEIPSGALKRKLWTPMFWGKWEHKENIGILEARAILKSIKRVCLTRYGHDIRHLHLSDNLGVVLSVERSRSRNFKLLKVIRCIAALCFSRNVQLAIRWIPSEFNISDEPSRIFDPGDSKLLVDLIHVDDFESFSPQVASHAHASQSAQKATDSPPCRQQLQQAKADSSSSADLRVTGATCASPKGEPLQSEATGPRFSEEETHRSSGSTTLFAKDQCRADTATFAKKGRGCGDGVRERQYLIRDGGREKRRQLSHAAKEAKKATAEESRRDHGWSPAREESFGSGGYLCKSQGELQQEMAGNKHHGKVERCQPGECGSSGRVVGEVVQSEIPGWGRRPLRRLHVGIHHGYEAGLQSHGRQEDSSSMESPSRLAQAVPISLEACVPFSSMGCFELADGCAWPCQQSRVQPAPGLDLPQTRRFAEAEEVGACAAYCGGDHTLVHPHKPERDNGCVKSGHQGRQRSSGFRIGCSSSTRFWKSLRRANPWRKFGTSPMGSIWQSFTNVRQS